MPNTDHLHKAQELHGNSRSSGSLIPQRTFSRRVSNFFQPLKITRKEFKEVSVASCDGDRSHQEDTAGYFFLLDSDLENQHDDVIEWILRDTFMRLGEQAKDYVSGSTLVACLQVGSRIFIANVGDSRAFLVVGSESNQTVMPLSWAHKPDEPSESKRILEAGGRVEDVKGTFRLNGNLATSRAFGDRMIGNGLIYEPDISKIVLEDNSKASVIVCSDGVTDAMETLDIQDFINQPYGKDFVITAKQLVSEAYSRRSEYFKSNSRDSQCDNISAVVTYASELTKDNSYPILSFVADGHGGSEVSEYIKQNLADVLSISIYDNLGKLLQVSEEPIREKSEIQDFINNPFRLY
ncbi:MAG: hypothetical protein AMJ43_05035 [Coxiella sp. DG_40]|nr:MAG: hypothetical protein AMJ43_05035 [Coxiella sp. DG_40]